MKRRKKDNEALQNKIKSKIALKGKRQKKADALKAPEKFIKQYRAQQKSYAHYRLKVNSSLMQNKQNQQLVLNGERKNVEGVGKLLLVIRIRGTTDISKQQRIILSRLNLRRINTAVFIKGTATNVRLLARVENYITWGEPSKKLISELIYKKLFGKVGEERIQIKSNAQVEKSLGGDIICIEDIINEIVNLGKNFDRITNFIFPFKLTTPQGTLASRIRKPV